MNFTIALDPVEKLLSIGGATGFEPAGDAPHEEGTRPDRFSPQAKPTRQERNLVALQRSIYAAFHPVSKTPFEDRPSVLPKPEHRLYQASFLLRDYG